MHSLSVQLPGFRNVLDNVPALLQRRPIVAIEDAARPLVDRMTHPAYQLAEKRLSHPVRQNLELHVSSFDQRHAADPSGAIVDRSGTAASGRTGARLGRPCRWTRKSTDQAP